MNADTTTPPNHSNQVPMTKPTPNTPGTTVGSPTPTSITSSPLSATSSASTTTTSGIPHQSSILIVVGWHRSNFLEFFEEHKIYFNPDWSWKTFILTVAKYIVDGREDEILCTNWAKVPGGESLMFIKLSSAAACSRGFDILCKSKGFAGCHVELRCS
ncbi:hypothetical protein HOY82DRAFT_535341 [Tuber indicum]|nr:hypothetical protein HOY82DRAFT_535341 [Tuber indicum]